MKKPIIYIVCTIISLFSVSKLVVAQDSTFTFYGRAIEANSVISVPFAHVINLTRNTGAIGDSLGYFDLKANYGDTLLLSALGFEYTYYTITPASIHMYSEWIEMKHKSYEIDEATVYYLGDYHDFTYKMMTLDLPEGSKINEYFYNSLPHNYPGVQPRVSIGSPISLLYYWFGKEGKELRKWDDAKVEAVSNQEIALKYNPVIVSELTGFTGDTLYDFIEFCNFTDDYLVNVMPYDLYEEIKRLKDLYLETKNRE